MAKPRFGGESSCGKTTLGRCMVRAIDPTEDNSKLMGCRRYRPVAGKELTRSAEGNPAGIPRPYSSLNPRSKDLVGEPSNLIAKGKAG